ncbi:ATPase F0F1 [Paenibacillus sp. IHBB 10380]|jgi:hypothetical protein|uniref:ATPase F0F1 n=1 Tax=Paenibacillus sp. IHBB 10380 TaxID=1566358 RepID=UPI0005CFBE57|nr:ATPase F0F1 [Paenibacillus sp. IHBB 10380]AJS60410.1 ATPase F0F1 [Paenibacillus sp. IHBB 10380]
MNEPNNNNNIWQTALHLGTAGGLLSTYILIGFFGGRWLRGLYNGPSYWLAIGTISGLVLGAIHVFVLIKKFLGEQDG